MGANLTWAINLIEVNRETGIKYVKNAKTYRLLRLLRKSRRCRSRQIAQGRVIDRKPALLPKANSKPIDSLAIGTLNPSRLLKRGEHVMNRRFRETERSTQIAELPFRLLRRKRVDQ